MEHFECDKSLETNSRAGSYMAVPLAAWIREKLALSVVRTLRRQILIRVWKMEIGEGSIISRTAKLDKTNPRGIHIGKYTVVAFGAAILTHDWVNNRYRDVYIGDNCFIGAHALILAGVTIGDNCIVSAASVVARDVPAGSLVAGNPARVVESNLRTTHYGVRCSRANENGGMNVNKVNDNFTAAADRA